MHLTRILRMCKFGELSKVPDVLIDPSGVFKYILIKVLR